MKTQEEIKKTIIDSLKKMHKLEIILGTCVFVLLNALSIFILHLIFIIGYLLFSTFLYIAFLKGIKQKYNKKISDINKIM